MDRFNKASRIVFEEYVDPVPARKLKEWSMDGVSKTYLIKSKFTQDDHRIPFSETAPLLKRAGKDYGLEDLQAEFRSLFNYCSERLWHFSPGDFVDSAIKGIIAHLDPQCAFLSPDDFIRLKSTIFEVNPATSLYEKPVQGVMSNNHVHARILRTGTVFARVESFDAQTARILETELTALKDQSGGKLRGLILDLRDNPGGLLIEAVEVSALFLKEGKIVTVKGRTSRNSGRFLVRTAGVERSYPIIVLINQNSASAAEIVAGALRAHKRALVFGRTSFGKGSVQAVEEIGNGYAIKITIAGYYTPEGDLIEGRGVVPDVNVSEAFAGSLRKGMKAGQGLTDDPVIEIALLAIEQTESSSFGDLLPVLKQVLSEKRLALKNDQNDAGPSLPN
ncbi:peptidase, S41 family [delta proteobacterium NaphS2]|nr:peptidase, S41 family [delta proteobacterium NaphS2]